MLQSRYYEERLNGLSVLCNISVPDFLRLAEQAPRLFHGIIYATAGIASYDGYEWSDWIIRERATMALLKMVAHASLMSFVMSSPCNIKNLVVSSLICNVKSYTDLITNDKHPSMLLPMRCFVAKTLKELPPDILRMHACIFEEEKSRTNDIFLSPLLQELVK